MRIGRHTRSWHVLPVVGVVVGLAVAGGLATEAYAHRARPVDRGTTSAPVTAVPVPTNPVTSATAPTVGVLPVGIRVPSIGVDAAVVPVSVSASGAIDVPADPGTVGWWAGGPLPGAAEGTAALVGHVDSVASGAGALFRLRDVAVGQIVSVSGDPAAQLFRITGVREYDKADLPAAQIFTRTGAPRLAIITCGGPFDSRTRHYRDNIVAFAVPVSSS